MKQPSDDLMKFKKRFDRVLGRTLASKRREVRSLTHDRFVWRVVDHACVLISGGGKRIRPYLAYLAYREAGGRRSGILETLVGLELFHAFALVHDDIMDRGKMRHGIKTANVVFGDSQAILLGDLLYNWSYELLAPTVARGVFAKMVDEVILGQMLDVDSVSRKQVSDRFLEEKMRLKTARYSFVRPMQVGVLLALGSGGLKTRDYKFCERFGLPLGLAFQIQDDLMDLTVTSSTLGKSTFNDIREGQKTVFTQRAPQLFRYKGKKIGTKEKREIGMMLEHTGAIEYGTKKMNTYFVQADQVADEKPIFKDIVAMIRGRRT